MQHDSPHVRTFSLWVLIERSRDVAGQWTAHCLDIDVVTQGNSIEHALHMAREAVVMAVCDDLLAGLEPTEHAAPEEVWARFDRMLQHTIPQPLSMIRPDDVTAIAVQLRLRVSREEPFAKVTVPTFFCSRERMSESSIPG